LGFFFGNSLGVSDFLTASFSESDSSSGFLQYNVEIHSENTGVWVIFDSQIDMFLDTESEISRGREVSFFEFEFFNFEAFFEEFFGFFTSDGYVSGNFFVSLDSERSNGVSGSGEHGGLSSQIFKHFGGFGELISGFSDAKIDNQFFDGDFFHGVFSALVLGF
jgi:hypothetical protein